MLPPGMPGFTLALLLAAAPPPAAAVPTGCAPPARPMLAEILYDAAGDDTGREFVELFNPTDRDWPLAGVRIEAGDGAAAGRWSTRWSGGAADTLRARGRFVVGGAAVAPPPQAIAELELQNGPDALRLSWPDGATEVVGYGALAHPEYACGNPAPDAPSGLALARVPDDADRGANALDFRATVPTPGRANLPGRDVALMPASLVLDPEQPAAGEAARLRGQIENRGAAGAGSSAVVLRALERAAGDERELAHAPHAAELAAGEAATFELTLPALPAGTRTLVIRAELAGDEAPENDADSLRVRVGSGPLTPTEIQFHPSAGEGEWVEVRNRSGAALDLTAFRLADRQGTPGTPAGGQGALAEDSLALLVQDRAALLARYPGLDAERIWQVSPWSSLNNSDDSSGVADVLVLREPDGTPVERAPYSAAGVPAGTPIERRDGERWSPAPDPGGTPLQPPRALPPLAGQLEVRPRRIDGGQPALLSWSLPWPRARLTIEVFDLAGRRVARVVDGVEVAARGERLWRPERFPAGRYLVALRATEAGGMGRASALAAIRMGGER
jgi:hypothetical protein